jgi:hypothetical protein
MGRLICYRISNVNAIYFECCLAGVILLGYVGSNCQSMHVKNFEIDELAPIIANLMPRHVLRPP